jgi:hypothetical protein
MKLDINNIPDGQSGNWRIETFEIPENSIENIRAMFKPGCRMIKPGFYKRIMRNGSVVMSNTPAEISDYRHFVWKAKGSVLINGLGLGCVLADVLKKESVEKVTVIEISSDVINLVAPFFKTDSRVSIIQADAFTWKPLKGERYNAVWHDIWDNICADNLDEMAKLHRKYGKRCDYQDSWCKELCKRYRGSR